MCQMSNGASSPLTTTTIVQDSMARHGRRATHAEVADFFSTLGYDNGLGVMNDYIGESRW